MTESEAKHILETDSCYECSRGSIYGATNCGNTQCNVARATNLAINALEKQIAKKPVEQYEENEPSYLCPICEHWVYFNESYCDECGQKLDWSEV